MSLYHKGKSTHRQYDDGVLLVLKKRSETLRALLERVRKEYEIDIKTPVTYAGRLDPMAEGLMVLLVGGRCKDKDTFLGLPKRYTFEVLFGVGTDTYDTLGEITALEIKDVSESAIQSVLLEIKGRESWSYPPFSSIPVDGKPLFAHARAGTLPTELPIKKGEIFELTLSDIERVSLHSLKKEIVKDIQAVSGDFRQEEIIQKWESVPEWEVVIAKFNALVSSGIYIRSIAHELGRALGIPAIAHSICREEVGPYRLTK
jgi:tRNA pseudouridine55 synthase